MEAPKGRWSGSELFWEVLVLLLALAGFWGWHHWQEQVVIKNHTFADRARGTLVSAQCGYIERERLRSGAFKLWTQDVAGLYQFALIDRAMAEADDRAVHPLVPKPVPTHGYFVRFLPMEDVEEVDGIVVRRQSFAYCLHPAEPGVTGKYIFLMGAGGRYRRCSSGVRPVPTAWPNDAEIRTYWSNDCGG